MKLDPRLAGKRQQHITKKFVRENITKEERDTTADKMVKLTTARKCNNYVLPRLSVSLISADRWEDIYQEYLNTLEEVNSEIQEIFSKEQPPSRVDIDQDPNDSDLEISYDEVIKIHVDVMEYFQAKWQKEIQAYAEYTVKLEQYIAFQKEYGDML